MSYAVIKNVVKKQKRNVENIYDKFRHQAKCIIFFNDGDDEIRFSIDGGDWIPVLPGDEPLKLKVRCSKIVVETDSNIEQQYRIIVSDEVII